jgi:hypothetical protein
MSRRRCDDRLTRVSQDRVDRKKRCSPSKHVSIPRSQVLGLPRPGGCPEDLKARAPAAAIDRGIAVRATASIFWVRVSYSYKTLIRRRATAEVSEHHCRPSAAQLTRTQGGGALAAGVTAHADITLPALRSWASGRAPRAAEQGIAHRRARPLHPAPTVVERGVHMKSRWSLAPYRRLARPAHPDECANYLRPQATQTQSQNALIFIALRTAFALTPIQEIARCLIPDFDGAIFSPEWKEALWARFFMEAPQRQRRSVERYNIVKRA